jgi:hypothetical protein
MRWPRRLFADEARLIAARGDETAQKLLLRDAFADPWIADSLRHNPAGPGTVLNFLADNVNYLPEGSASPRHTYQQRRSAAGLDRTRDDETLLSAFVSLINDLNNRGYFARRLTDAMLIGGPPSAADGAIDLLRRDLGWRLVSWPLNPIDLINEPPLSPWDEHPPDPTDQARLLPV